jgi:predicted RNase H-like HicB family nuclease
MVRYAVQLVTRYDGLVIASFPDLPGVTALGRDHEEALAEARRELDTALKTYAAEGGVPPEPRTQSETMVEAEPVVPLAAV